MDDTAKTAILESLEGKQSRKRVRPLRVVLIAACVCIALVGTTVAISEPVQRALINGGSYFYGQDENGTTISGGESPESPIELRDGRFYLVINGEETDITGQFSETEYYLHRVEHEDGTYEDVVIGGTEEAYGYIICIYDETGHYRGGFGGGTYEDNMAPTAWRSAYESELGFRND